MVRNPKSKRRDPRVQTEELSYALVLKIFIKPKDLSLGDLGT